MPVVVVANPKGGVGKSTLSTNVAGYFASRGHATMLGDTDKQQSSRRWLGVRPDHVNLINTWDIGSDRTAKPPKGITHVVLDTPAGLEGAHLAEVMRHADKVLIPLQPSIFDIFATRDFLDQMARLGQNPKRRIGIVGMRVDARTIAADKLHEFVDSLSLPVLSYLRDTQNYIHLAARGLTLFDLAPSRVGKDLAQWESICHWLDN